ADLEDNLYKLWNRLSSGSYFPPPVRRVEIPKRDGHHRSDLSLTELAPMYNPCIRGWIAYYSHFYKTQLRPTLKRIDAYVIRWARRKFKQMRHQTKGARDWWYARRVRKVTTAFVGRTGASLRTGSYAMAHGFGSAWG